MATSSPASQPDSCPMCDRRHDRLSQDPPSLPCPLCSATSELEAMTASGRLKFVISILTNLRAASKEAALHELVGSLVVKRALTECSGQSVLDALSSHEQLMSNELGCGIAIVYARYAGVDSALGAFARAAVGSDFGCWDGQPVHLVFLIVSPSARPADHLYALRDVARYLKSFDTDPDARDS